jgi:hypothetical protein
MTPAEIVAAALGSAIGDTIAEPSQAQIESDEQDRREQSRFASGAEQDAADERAAQWVSQDDEIQARRMYESSLPYEQENFRGLEQQYRQATDVGATTMDYRADDNGAWGLR